MQIKSAVLICFCSLFILLLTNTMKIHKLLKKCQKAFKDLKYLQINSQKGYIVKKI